MKKSKLLGFIFLSLIVSLNGFSQSQKPIYIGSKVELFVDSFLIDKISGDAELRLHNPIRREIVMVHNKPWEGNSCGYYTVFKDGNKYRMYYRGGEQSYDKNKPPHENVTCYAESRDGIHWVKPILKLFNYNGSKENNIIWKGVHNFTPFIDQNPNCPKNQKYKALGSINIKKGKPALFAFKSSDGIHWSLLFKKPILSPDKGEFDSQNVAFWDKERKEYRIYFRKYRKKGRNIYAIRDIKTAVSKDFFHWSKPVFLKYPGAPEEQLYTNQIIPYFRAPHIFLGFPTRYIDRGWSYSMEKLPRLNHRKKRASLSQREGTALTDGLFMSSRDGKTFYRWPEAFIRPGQGINNWVYGDNYQNWGLVLTKSNIEGAPKEISIYASEDYWTGEKGSKLRRFTIRVDGFVSLHATLNGGELITKPFIFEGRKLLINFSTSAAGNIKFELQNEEGKAFPGFSLNDCEDMFGDSINRVVKWKKGVDLSKISGKVVRLRVSLKDADLYSIKFSK